MSEFFSTTPITAKGGRVVSLLSRPPKKPLEDEPQKKPERIPPRTKEHEIPDEKVRLVRALCLIGLRQAQVARMTGCNAASVGEYHQLLRRRGAGAPSDAEIREAGVMAAEYAINARKAMA